MTNVVAAREAFYNDARRELSIAGKTLSDEWPPGVLAPREQWQASMSEAD